MLIVHLLASKFLVLTVGLGGIFVLGCPLASSVFSWWRVSVDRLVLPHHSIRASFGLARWLAWICQLVQFPVIWPAAWVSPVDRTRSSESAQVRCIWEVYDECHQTVHPSFWESVRSVLMDDDVSLAWNVWLYSAETSLAHAFFSAGRLLLASGVRFGRGSAQFKKVASQGPFVGKNRAGTAGSDDGLSVHLHKDASVTGIILQSCRLKCVLSVLDGAAGHGLSDSRSLELGVQWRAVVAAGPCGPLCGADLAISPNISLSVFGACVRSLHDNTNAFLPDVVAHRKDVAVRSWRSWVLEDLQVHPWLSLIWLLLPPSGAVILV